MDLIKALTNSILVVFRPKLGWRAVANNPLSIAKLLLAQTAPLALIPAVCWYYGVTTSGWAIAGEVMRLTPASALPMCVMFYFAMLGGVVFLGLMVSWMSDTYGDHGTAREGITLITYTAVPFFLAGFMGLAPLLWLNILIGVGIACYCIYLLYVGVPVVMHVPPERGFLYASAVFAVALVSFVGLLTGTVMLWDFGAAPEYTY